MESREFALKILFEINQKDAYSNIAINRNLNASLKTSDESLIRELVYGVTENRLFIDWVIRQFSKIKFKKIAPIVIEILRLGIYQILFMDRIPNRAAVNEAVKLAKKHSHKGVQGFVNGVLRNIARNTESISIPDNKKRPIQYLSIKYSHPEWMIKRWIEDYGYEFAEGLCIANNRRPKLNIRTNTLKLTQDDLYNVLLDNGFIVKKTKYAYDGIVVDNPIRITETSWFREGLFQIQDESSMLVAQILDPKEGSLVLDVCSAPGGKASHIAQRMINKGNIIARDIYKHKLQLIKENASHLGIDIIHTEEFNALELDENLIEKVDYCLVDVPCSGLGLIRRKPDIKWRKKEDDIDNITNLQLKILSNAGQYLLKGGVLVYSTCTIEREENIKLIKKFLNNNDNFALVGFNHLIENASDFPTAVDGYIEIYPNIHDLDGFFIAKMVKI